MKTRRPATMNELMTTSLNLQEGQTEHSEQTQNKQPFYKWAGGLALVHLSVQQQKTQKITRQLDMEDIEHQPRMFIGTINNKLLSRAKSVFYMKNTNSREKNSQTEVSNDQVLLGYISQYTLGVFLPLFNEDKKPLLYNKANVQQKLLKFDHQKQSLSIIHKTITELMKTQKSLLTNQDFGPLNIKQCTGIREDSTQELYLIDNYITLFSRQQDKINAYIKDSNKAGCFDRDYGSISELKQWKQRSRKLTQVHESHNNKKCRAIYDLVDQTDDKMHDYIVLFQKIKMVTFSWTGIDKEITDYLSYTKNYIKNLQTFDKYLQNFQTGNSEKIKNTLLTKGKNHSFYNWLARQWKKVFSRDIQKRQKVKNFKRTAGTSILSKINLGFFMALLTGDHQSLVKAEEASILDSASVSTTLKSSSANGDVFINGSFKSSIVTNSNSGSNDIQVDLNLPETQIVHEVLILNKTINQNTPMGIGNTNIVLANGASETVSKSLIFDTGIYKLEPPGEATSIIIRRVSGSGYFSLNHMRAYQCTNLMQYGATIFYETPSIAGNEAQNLIDNPESRSSTDLWNARATASSNYGNNLESFKSCYITDQTKIAADGDLMMIVFDFQVKYFMHAVLMLDDLKGGQPYNNLSVSDKRKFFQNAQIYIGDDPNNATNNRLCLGGPFLKIDDLNNYFDYDDNSNSSNAKPWKYGQEAWCNLEGRYLHVIANLSHQSGQTFTQAICSFSVFGTIYTRNSGLPQEVSVEQGQTATISIPHIYADLTRPIGNILAINVRQTSDLNTQITNTDSETVLIIDTSDLDVGTHDLIIESFDENSIPKSALKTDIIQIIVLEPELSVTEPELLETEPEPELFEIEPSFKSQLQSQVIRLGEPISWTLPEIRDGSYPLESISFQVDQRLINNLRLDQDSRTFTFSDKKVQIAENLLDQLVRLEIRLVDTNKNVVFYVQMLEIVQVGSDETESEQEEQSVIENQANQVEQGEKSVSSSGLQSTQQDLRQKESEQVQEETKFNISQALIDLYSSQFAFQNLSKRLDDQKQDLKSQIQDGQRPLELRVKEISNSGRVQVIFTKQINFPDNLEQLIKDSQTKSDPIVEIIMIGPDQTVNSNLQSWSIDSISDQKIVFKLQFTSPLAISQDDGADQIIFHFRMSQWVTEQKEKLPQFVTKTRELPRQVVSEKEAETISSVGKIASSGSVTISAIYSASMILVYASLNKLWSFINSQQVLIQMPLMKNIKFPANAGMFQSFLINIVNLDIFPTEWLEELIYYLPEQKPFNINFEASGIESNLFILNTGSGIWIILAFSIYAVINLAFYGWKRVWNRFGNPIFFNGITRTFMEMFQDLLFFAVLNLRTAEWDTPYDDVHLSNVLSVIIVSISGLSALFLIIWLCLNRNKINDKKFKERSGTLVQSTNTETHKWTIIAIFFMFFFRKIVFVMSVIFLQDFVWGQISIQNFTSLGMMIMIQWYQPYDSKFANNIEVFNEICVLLLTYYAICFTDFVLDPQVKNDLGYSYIGLSSTMISVHLSVLAISFTKALIIKCKMMRKNSKDISQAKKINDGQSTKSTPDPAETPQLQRRAQIQIASVPNTELMIIEEKEEEKEESERIRSAKEELAISEESKVNNDNSEWLSSVGDMQDDQVDDATNIASAIANSMKPSNEEESNIPRMQKLLKPGSQQQYKAETTTVNLQKIDLSMDQIEADYNEIVGQSSTQITTSSALPIQLNDNKSVVSTSQLMDGQQNNYKFEPAVVPEKYKISLERVQIAIQKLDDSLHHNQDKSVGNSYIYKRAASSFIRDQESKFEAQAKVVSKQHKPRKDDAGQ